MRGEDLAGLRAARDLSQVELAGQLGVSRRTLQNWERGAVPRKDRERVAEFFGVEVVEEPEPEVPEEPDSTVGALVAEHGLPEVLEALARVVARAERRSA